MTEPKFIRGAFDSIQSHEKRTGVRPSRVELYGSEADGMELRFGCIPLGHSVMGVPVVKGQDYSRESEATK